MPSSCATRATNGLLVGYKRGRKQNPAADTRQRQLPNYATTNLLSLQLFVKLECDLAKTKGVNKNAICALT